MGQGRRCFVAVPPPQELIDLLSAVRRPSIQGLRWTPPEQWHVTLRFLPDADPDALVEALAALRWPTGGPLLARAGPSSLPLSGRVLVLPVDGLEPLARAVAAATASLGPLDARPYRGHLTLARSRRPGAAGALGLPPIAAEWMVDEIRAYESSLLPEGPRHTLLGRRRRPGERPK